MHTVLITGACVNTGVDIVHKFASEGWRVLFTGRKEEAVMQAQSRYRAAYPSVSITGYTLPSLRDAYTVDEEAAERLYTDLDRQGITVDVLVLNAAHQGLGMRVLESPLSDFMQVINTNMTWNFCMAVKAARRMCRAGGGSIIFVNSNTAYRAIPDRVAYAASKSGQLGMMRALALDLGRYNIRVNAVLPGMIRTDRWTEHPDFYSSVPSRFTPLGDVATGADIADAVWYFAAHARNTTGAELVVDGGNMIQLYPIIPQAEEQRP